MKTKSISEKQTVDSQDRQGMKRRDFLKLSGGGIFILFNTWDLLGSLAGQSQPRRELPTDFNAFLQIGEDGMVSGFTGKIEMGQGPITSLAQMLADELDVKYEHVTMVMGDTDLCPWDRGTFGSLTTRSFGIPWRAAAAEARGVLLQLGSEHLGVPVTQLEVKEGVITDKRDNKNHVSYAQLARGRKIERYLDQKPPVKKHTDFKIMGKSFLRQDAMLKVTGQAKYAGDYHLPGMLYARILRPPSHGATLVSADTSEAEKLEGIQTVRDGDLIAVLHELPDKAKEAIEKVKAKYSFDEIDVDDKSIFEYLVKSAPKGNLQTDEGDLATGRAISQHIVESEYYNSYVAHAPIEPHTAMAYPEDDRMIVRGSTQAPFSAQESIADALDMDLEKVRVITPFVGGGFGGKPADG